MSDVAATILGSNLSPLPMESLSTGSSLTPELERDYYKQKVEHFKVLIRKLQDEVQSLKLRKEGTATVSKLLQESKQELGSLTKKIRAYESVFRILQSRLEKNGLSSEITLQDDEQLLPGVSKSLVDNLTRENKRLRNVLKANNGDPEQLARLQQTLSENQLTINTLHGQIAELETILSSSDNDKVRTITQLREELAHLNREISARDIRCTTLAKEAETLQSQLEDVAHQCHDLAKKLHDQTTNGHSGTTPSAQTARKEESPMDVHDESAAVAEENKALKRQVQEISVMNHRWQEYNKQREMYVTQLTRELNEAKAAQTSGSANHEFQQQMNQVLDDARRQITDANRQKNEMQVQLDAAKRRMSEMTDEIRHLKSRAPGGTGPDTDETIQALKAQIQICTEDFESERKDREKAQTKIVRLESEMMKLRREVDEYRRNRDILQNQNVYTDPHLRYDQYGASDNIGTERLAIRGAYGQRDFQGRPENANVIDGKTTTRYHVLETPDVTKDVAGSYSDPEQQPQYIDRGPSKKTSDDEYHSLRTSSLSSSSNRASPTPSKRSENASPTYNVTSPCLNIPLANDDTANLQTPRSPGLLNQSVRNNECLKCPKCAKEYTSDEHSELLEHIEMCCD